MAIAGRPKAEGIQHICSAIVAVVVVAGLSSIAVAKKRGKVCKNMYVVVLYVVLEISGRRRRRLTSDVRRRLICSQNIEGLTGCTTVASSYAFSADENTFSFSQIYRYHLKLFISKHVKIITIRI